MFSERTSVGLDVHVRSVRAAALDTSTGELVESTLTCDFTDIDCWLAKQPGPVAVAYEAGPTGFGLCRYLTGRGIRCVVVAPSKLQRPSGDRVKTDARDAIHLCRLLRLDEYTPVTLPSIAQESARDLVRAREACRSDLMRVRHRVSKLLLRRGIVYSEGRTWSLAHLGWLARKSFDSRALQLAYDEALDAVLTVSSRRDRLDAAITEMAGDSEFTPIVHRLACLRGVNTLTAFGLAVEIGDWSRFTGNTIGAYVGLVPCERSSGQSRSQGPITKTGNTHVRRLLVEAAWHHRPQYRVGKVLRDRWDLATPAARARGDAGNRRLHHRWHVFTTRKKTARRREHRDRAGTGRMVLVLGGAR